MQTQRRYVIRICRKGRFLAGILENAHTGAESPFNGARELVSLLCAPDAPSSETLQPKGGLRKSGFVDGRQRPKRRT